MEYTSNSTMKQIAERLNGAAVKRVLVTAHAKPDGDALGAAAALGGALKAAGKSVELRLMPPIPQTLRFLVEGLELVVHEGAATKNIVEPDVVMVLDTGAWSQLEPLKAWLAERREKTIVIDHHMHGDDVGTMRYVEAKAAATCELVAELIEAMGVKLTKPIAEALFVGIASDTGWFRFSNTTPGTHELAARLLRAGVDHSGLHLRTEQDERPQKLALLARALNSAQFIAEGKAVVMTLTRADFEQTGARDDETERFVDAPQVVGGVRVAALITEQNAQRTRLSFRSKPGKHAVDVNQLASQFGGGGHVRAAGAKVDQPLAAVRQRVVEAIEAALKT